MESANKEVLLRRFICKAKRDYCIQYVGATVSGFKSAKNFDDVTNNVFRFATPPYIFDASLHRSDYFESLKFVEEDIQNEDERYYVGVKQ